MPRVGPGRAGGPSGRRPSRSQPDEHAECAAQRRGALALGKGSAVLAAGTAGPAAWYLIPTSFRAQARLHVAAEPPKVLFQTVETQIHDDYRRYQSTQQTLVRSHLVLSAALRDPKVGGCATLRRQVDPTEWLGENLKVEFVGGSEVMEISLNGSAPEDLAIIVNRVVKAYMDEVVDVDARRRMGRRDQLVKYKDRYAELLKRKRETMRKLAESVGSDDHSTLALRQQYAMEDKHHLESELRSVLSQKRRLEAELKTAGPASEAGPAAPSPSFSDREIDVAVDRHPSVAELTRPGTRQPGSNASRPSWRRRSRRVARNRRHRSLAARHPPARDVKAASASDCWPSGAQGRPRPRRSGGRRRAATPSTEGSTRRATAASAATWRSSATWSVPAQGGDQGDLDRQPLADGQHPGPRGEPGGHRAVAGDRRQDRRRGRVLGVELSECPRDPPLNDEAARPQTERQETAA